MRVSVFFVMLTAGLLAGAIVADEAKGPYSRVATGQPPHRDGAKVYTNADLQKMFGIVAPEDRAQPPTETAEVPADPDAPPPAESDSLSWLRQRQEAQREHRVALADAQAALTAARNNVANLERQQLASRNPFSARPDLSEEEEAQRRKGGETASQRHERTKLLLEKAREEVRAAEAEVARLRAQRP